MSFVDEMTWRGLIQQKSDEQLGDKMAAERFTGYAGFDPTAASLHLGNLVSITTLMRLQRAGHRPVALIGGATGMVGDPSGKSAERKLLSVEELQRNLAGIRAQLERFLDFSPGQALLVNNGDWFAGYGYLDFLRDVGKHFSVNMMLAKESVRARLEDRESGISYTEFSYMLIQAYDYLHLYDAHQCRLQIGGSDQWGNITVGVDLIRRLRQGEAFALTTPLITDASGKKFGKSERGALWLDRELTSPDEIYQYFINVDDRDVGRLLRTFTFLDRSAIEELERTVERAPEKREAQKQLAYLVVELIHGQAEAARCAGEAQHRAQTRGLEAGALNQALARGEIRPDSEDPRRALLSADGVPLVELLVSTRLCSSKSDARRQIEQGGVHLNNQPVADPQLTVRAEHLLEGGCVHLRRGKKNIHVVRFV
jgi:tyrosyl-tRNA synthetase